MKDQLARLNEGNSSAMTNGVLSVRVSGSSAGSVGIGSMQGAANSLIYRAELEKQLKYIANLAHHMYFEVRFLSNDCYLTGCALVFPENLH